MGKVFSTRKGTRVGSMATRKVERKVEVYMVCGDFMLFNPKIKPKTGEIIWCARCAKYREVT